MLNVMKPKIFHTVAVLPSSLALLVEFVLVVLLSTATFTFPTSTVSDYPDNASYNISNSSNEGSTPPPQLQMTTDSTSGVITSKSLNKDEDNHVAEKDISETDDLPPVPKEKRSSSPQNSSTPENKNVDDANSRKLNSSEGLSKIGANNNSSATSPVEIFIDLEDAEAQNGTMASRGEPLPSFSKTASRTYLTLPGDDDEVGGNDTLMAHNAIMPKSENVSGSETAKNSTSRVYLTLEGDSDTEHSGNETNNKLTPPPSSQEGEKVQGPDFPRVNGTLEEEKNNNTRRAKETEQNPLSGKNEVPEQVAYETTTEPEPVVFQVYDSPDFHGKEFVELENDFYTLLETECKDSSCKEDFLT